MEDCSTRPNGDVSAFSYNGATNTATWTLSSAFPADQIIITLFDTVTDLAGVPLDGEWSNPVTISVGADSFPSGDGTFGGDFDFRFTILPGDANRDNEVDGLDYVIWAMNYQSGTTFEEGDFTGDGIVNGLDYVQWAINFGTDFRTFNPGGGAAMMMSSLSSYDRFAAAEAAVFELYNSGQLSWTDDALDLFDLDVSEDSDIAIEDFFALFKTLA